MPSSTDSGTLHTAGAVALGLALLASPQPAAADYGDDPGPGWLLHTNVSGSGSFVVEYYIDPPNQAKPCLAEVEPPVFTLEPQAGGAPIALTSTQLAQCVFAYAPTAPLPSASYCVKQEASPTRTWGCFQVTGTEPALTGLSLAGDVVADLEQAERCETCDDGVYQACTRLEHGYTAGLALVGAAEELAASHVYSVSLQPADTASEGEGPFAPALPVDAVWEPFIGAPFVGAALGHFTTPFVCLDVYVRPIAGGDSSLVASTCLARPVDAEIPAPFDPLAANCETGFHARWCTDNRADCGQPTPELADSCGGYEQLCNADGSVKPLAQPAQDSDAPPREDESSEAPESGTTDTDDGAPAASPESNSSTCSVQPASAPTSAGLVLWMLAGLALLCRSCRAR